MTSQKLPLPQNERKITIKIDEYISTIYDKLFTSIDTPNEKLVMDIVFKKYLTDYICATIVPNTNYSMADIAFLCISAFKDNNLM